MKIEELEKEYEALKTDREKLALNNFQTVTAQRGNEIEVQELPPKAEFIREKLTARSRLDTLIKTISVGAISVGTYLYATQFFGQENPSTELLIVLAVLFSVGIALQTFNRNGGGFDKFFATLTATGLLGASFVFANVTVDGVKDLYTTESQAFMLAGVVAAALAILYVGYRTFGFCKPGRAKIGVSIAVAATGVLGFAAIPTAELMMGSTADLTAFSGYITFASFGAMYIGLLIFLYSVMISENALFKDLFKGRSKLMWTAAVATLVAGSAIVVGAGINAFSPDTVPPAIGGQLILFSGVILGALLLIMVFVQSIKYNLCKMNKPRLGVYED